MNLTEYLKAEDTGDANETAALQVKNGRITEWGCRVLLGESSIGTTAVSIPAPAPEPTIPPLRRRTVG